MQIINEVCRNHRIAEQIIYADYKWYEDNWYEDNSITALSRILWYNYATLAAVDAHLELLERIVYTRTRLDLETKRHQTALRNIFKQIPSRYEKT